MSTFSVSVSFCVSVCNAALLHVHHPVGDQNSLLHCRAEFLYKDALMQIVKVALFSPEYLWLQSHRHIMQHAYYLNTDNLTNNTMDMN